MPRLKPDTQRARREHILDAAELCFARAGFHRTSMQDICKEATVSPGALYIYFDSKEALIAGIAERDREEFQTRFETLKAAPDFLKALEQLAERYFVEEPPHKRLMCLEIGLESTRNPRVGEIFQRVDEFVSSSFETLFQRLKDEGRIDPELTVPELATVFMTLGDGLFWRRGTDPKFNPRETLPLLLRVMGQLLRPARHKTSEDHNKKKVEIS